MPIGSLRPIETTVAVAIAFVLIAFSATLSASASSSGTCTVSGSSGSSTVDIGGLEPGQPWRVRSGDRLSVEVTAPFAFRDPESFEEQAGGVTTFYFLASLGIMERHASVLWGSGAITGYDLARNAILGPRFGMGGAAYGPSEEDSCGWYVDIVVDDVNPFLTVFGGGALAVAALGIAGIIVAARRGRGRPARIVATILGGVSGAALFSAIGQFGLIAWDEPGGIGLLAGAVIGLVASGVRRSAGVRPTI